MLYVIIVIYIISILRLEKVNRTIMGIVAGLAFVEIIAILVSPFTNLLFEVRTDTIITNTICYIFFIIVVAFLTGVALYHMFRYSSTLRPYQRYTLYAAILCMMIAFIAQFVFLEYQPGCFLSALILMFLFFSIEDPSEYFYRYNMCYNEFAFSQIKNTYSGRYTSKAIVFVGIKDYGLISMYFSREKTENIKYALIKAFVTNFEKKNVFYLGKGTFALVIRKEEECNERLLEAKIGDTVGGVDEGFTLESYSALLLMKDVDNAEDIGVALELFRRIVPNIDKGKRFVIFDKKDFGTRNRERAVLEAVSKGLSYDRFSAYYQPIYDMSVDGYASCEVLMRLEDPEIGMIYPDEFMPVADKYGLTQQMGDRIFELVCKTVKRSSLRNLGIIFMHINVSRSQCVGSRLSDSMNAICRKYDVDPKIFGIEISENTCINDKGVILENVLSLKRRGMSFAIDNFGCVFSRADKITGFPVRYIKFDRKTIKNAALNPQSRVILEHLVKMIKDLGYKAVACGVETEDIYRMLFGMGFELFQGYYFSKPMPEEEYLSFITSRARKREEADG